MKGSKKSLQTYRLHIDSITERCRFVVELGRDVLKLKQC